MPNHVLDAVLQGAAERTHQRKLSALLTGPAAAKGRPAVQASYCIDLRSEVLRQALEAQDLQIETLGCTGFFGLPIIHRPKGTDAVQAHLHRLWLRRLDPYVKLFTVIC